jgi:hypothetical protein
MFDIVVKRRKFYMMDLIEFMKSPNDLYLLNLNSNYIYLLKTFILLRLH